MDPAIQMRVSVDDAVVDDYVQALESSVVLPPIVVFRCDALLYVADGFHRYRAYERLGRRELEADVRFGTRAELLWFALGANRAHGLRLTRDDKRKMVEFALKAWPDRTNVAIAEQVGCSEKYVRTVKKSRSKPSVSQPRSSADDPGVSAVPSPGSSDREESDDSLSLSAGVPAALSFRFPAGRSADDDGDDSPASGASFDAPEPILSPREIARSMGLAEAYVHAARALDVDTDGIRFPALDPLVLPDWIEQLEKTRTGLTRFIKALREEVGDGGSEEPVPPAVEDRRPSS